jgi:hypothetical protein
VSTAPRRAEFFALEANEYLTDLDPVVAARERPDAERLVRGARALRGAALMAGLGTYARAAAGLEAIARQVRDHALSWDPHAREAWADGLTALRMLVTHAGNWEAADDRQALALAERFEEVMSGRPPRAAAPAPTTLTPGVRAFIARESARIAGSLEQASRALAPTPPAEALAGVLERMQSLRGLGASAELSPLPELLDAMEVATRALLSDAPSPPNVAALFADAAHALSAIARSVADAGQIVTPPELPAIAQRLLEAYASDSDVVTIAQLAPDGVDSIVHHGTPPSALPEADPVPVELVGVGDHFLTVADALARPGSPAARDLRLFVLHRTLAAMPSRSATGRFLAPLADAISTAIRNRVATERPDAFVAMVRGCGRFLVEAGATNDRIAITRRRDAIATSLVMVGLGAPAGGFEAKAIAPPAPATKVEMAPIAALQPLVPERPLVDTTDVVSIDSLAPDDATDVVSIESLTYTEPAEVVSIESLAYTDHADLVSIESLAPDFEPVVAAPLPPPIPAEAPGDPTRLERAFITRGALSLEATDDAPSLGGLIAAQIVPVDTLLYRGGSAVSRVDELRAALERALTDPAIGLDRLRPLLQELLDLIPLARDAA